MIIPDLPLDEYHAAPHVSASKVSTFLRSGPRAYWLRHVRGERSAPTSEAFAVGQAFEDAVCGRPSHVLPPEGMKFTTKAGKEWKAEQTATVIPASCAGLFEHGVQHVRDNRTAAALIDASQEQATARTEWPGTPGVQTRPDWLSLTGCPESDWAPVAPDLKTVASLGMFERQVREFGYHRQAAMVDLCLRDEGVEGVRHPLIVVEKAFPYRCVVTWLSPAYVAIGDADVCGALGALAEHYESDEWPTVTSDETTLEPPAWMVPDDDEGG